MFKTENRNWGFYNFVKASFVLYPKNDKFAILCRIIVKKNNDENTVAENQRKKEISRLEEFNRFEKLLTNEKFSDITVIAHGKTCTSVFYHPAVVLWTLCLKIV